MWVIRKTCIHLLAKILRFVFHPLSCELSALIPMSLAQHHAISLLLHVHAIKIPYIKIKIMASFGKQAGYFLFLKLAFIKFIEMNVEIRNSSAVADIAKA